MTRQNFSLDNPSPLLTYSPLADWTPITKADVFLSMYANGSTGTTTPVPGSQVTFTFSGTGVWVYGAMRPNHGFYNVTLGNLSTTRDGYASPEVFQTLLFGASNLEMAEHEFTIVNAGPLNSGDSSRNWFDIDWVVWETEFEGPGGPTGAEISMTTFDNDHPRFQYLPSSGSWTESSHTDGFLNGTSAITTSSDASVELTFDGDAVALYGSVDANHGNFVGSVDNKHSRTLSGFYNASAFQQMLYYADELGAGTHTLTIQNHPVNAGRNTFSLDYAQTWSARGGSGGGDGPTPTPKPQSKTITTISAVVGAIVFLALAAALAIFLLQKRRKAKKNSFERDPYFIAHAPSPKPSSSYDSSSLYYANQHNVLSNSPSGQRDMYDRHTSNPSIDSTASNATDSSLNALIIQQVARSNNNEPEPIPMSRYSYSQAYDPSNPSYNTDRNYRGHHPSDSNTTTTPAIYVTAASTEGHSPTSPYSAASTTSYPGLSAAAEAAAAAAAAASTSRQEPRSGSKKEVHAASPISQLNASSQHGMTRATPEELRTSRAEMRGRAQDSGPLLPVDDPYGVELLPPSYSRAVQPWEVHPGHRHDREQRTEGAG